ncbi:unnamed protein product [Calypogeia fissa]
MVGLLLRRTSVQLRNIGGKKVVHSRNRSEGQEFNESTYHYQKETQKALSGHRLKIQQLQQLQQDQNLDLVSGAQDGSLLSASSAATSSEEPSIIYEDGIEIETVLDENRLAISIYSTLAAPSKDFLYAIDSTASQLLKIQLPIDQSKGAAVARRVAGDGKGRTGYNDGWGEDALLYHPKGLAVDCDGNVYVADVWNRVIRKISPEGYVTTVAGQPNKTGYADGDGKKALFSSDFTLTYLPRTCSLLISDRGNQRLRMIQLKNPPEICDSEGRRSSVRVWKTVTYIFGVLVTILSAALGVVLFQKAELQRSGTGALALDDEGESPLNRYQNGGPNNFPYLTPRPRLADSTAALRRGSSLPDNALGHSSDLMDFSDSPSYEEKHNGPTGRIRNFASGRSRDPENDAENEAENGDLSSEEGDVLRTPDGARIGSVEEDLLADPESLLTGSDDSFSRHPNNNSSNVAPDRRLTIDDALRRSLDLLTHHGGN